MIHFNVPPVTGNEGKYIEKAIANHKICGDGEYTKNATHGLKKNSKAARFF